MWREPLIFGPEDGKRRLQSLGQSVRAIMIAHPVKYIGQLRNSRECGFQLQGEMYDRFSGATIHYNVDGLRSRTSQSDGVRSQAKLKRLPTQISTTL